MICDVCVWYNLYTNILLYITHKTITTVQNISDYIITYKYINIIYARWRERKKHNKTKKSLIALAKIMCVVSLCARRRRRQRRKKKYKYIFIKMSGVWVLCCVRVCCTYVRTFLRTYNGGLLRKIVRSPIQKENTHYPKSQRCSLWAYMPHV